MALQQAPRAKAAAAPAAAPLLAPSSRRVVRAPFASHSRGRARLSCAASSQQQAQQASRRAVLAAAPALALLLQGRQARAESDFVTLPSGLMVQDIRCVCEHQVPQPQPPALHSAGATLASPAGQATSNPRRRPQARRGRDAAAWRHRGGPLGGLHQGLPGQADRQHVGAGRALRVCARPRRGARPARPARP
jgi:hypothetical protein